MSVSDQDEKNGQNSYTPTEYLDQHWEIIGEYREEQFFIADHFEVLGDSSLTVDPMFADYGGLPPKAKSRCHAPGGIEAGSLDTRRFTGGAKAALAEDDNKIKLTQEELDTRLEAARQEGALSALEQSIEQHQQQLESLQQSINVVLKDIDNQFKERVATIEQQALQLTLEISKMLLRDAVELNPEYILPLISDAIEKVGTASIKRVRVSPEDMEFINIIGVEKQLKEFDGTWIFESDESVRSGCIVDTSAGEIDFQLDRAWERARDKILRIGARHG